MKIEKKSNIAKYILAFGSAQGLSVAINLVRNKLVAMLLGPNGMGLMALYSASVKLVQDSTNLGLASSGVKVISQEMDNENPIKLCESITMMRSWVAVSAVFGTLLCIAFSWLLSITSFTDTSHTLHYIVLSPVVGLSLIAAGEVAVLKATRNIKKVISLSLWTIILTLIISVPMFYLWRAKAIIPSLVVVAFAQAMVTICYSYRKYKPKLSFRKETLKKGLPMLRLGLAFVLAAVVASASEYLIRAFLNIYSNDSTVGLYNAGYMIAFTYAGAVFSAIDSEYFPRLSALFGQGACTAEINATIQRQIKVSLMIIVPMVIVLVLLLPWILPLLFSEKFTEAIPMAQISLGAMVVRSVYLPLAYIPLAKGDSRTFIMIEVASSIYLLATVVGGFLFMGITGCGVGLVVSCVLELITTMIICKKQYNLSYL